MKIPFFICSITVFLTGCSSLPSPKEPNGSWTPVNQVREVTKATNSVPFAHVLAESAQQTTCTKDQSSQDKGASISLEKAIEHYIPSTYHVEVDPDVDLQSMISLDNSKNWLEALGQGMSEANIEFITNYYKKSATIKTTKLTMAETIERLLPTDYTVLMDSGVDQNALLHFDTRKYWVEALNNGTKGTGIELTINFTKRIIYLTPTSRSVSQSTVKTSE